MVEVTGAGQTGDVVVVSVTTPDEDLAGTIARRVVEERVAACAQVGGPIRSTYRWDGAIQVDEEWTVTIKTVASRVAELGEIVAGLHPYEVPELVVLPVVGGSPDYLTWVRAES